MLDIFLIYHPANQARAMRLARALERCGYAVGWTPRLAPTPEDRAAALQAAAGARLCVALWSKAIRRRKSPLIADLARMARRRGRLLAASIDPGPRPLGFDQVRTVKLSGWAGGAYAPAFRILTQEIGARTGRRARRVRGFYQSVAPASAPRPPAAPETAPQGQPPENVGREAPAPRVGEQWERAASLWRHFRKVRSVAFGLDGTVLLTACADGSAKLWETETEAFLGEIEALGGDVLKAAFHPSQPIIATGTEDGAVRLWDLTAPDAPIIAAEGFEGPVSDLRFDASGARLAFVCDAGFAGVLAAETGALQFTVDHGGAGVTAALFDPTGRRLLTTGGDGAARLWGVATSGAHKDADEAVMAFDDHPDWVRAAAFDPTGAFLSTASDDGSLRLWSVDGTYLGALETHEDWVLAVAFDPSGQRLAAASLDRSFSVWDVQTGELVARVRAHSDVVSDIAFASPWRLATASWDGSAALWELTDAVGAISQGPYVDAASTDTRTLTDASPEEEEDAQDPSPLFKRQEPALRPAFLSWRSKKAPQPSHPVRRFDPKQE